MRNYVITNIPGNITYEEASHVSGSAITVLNFLKGMANIKQNDTVLINGVPGGLDTYAVQFAKHIGAEVTGVCSTLLGADKVGDYKKIILPKAVSNMI